MRLTNHAISALPLAAAYGLASGSAGAGILAGLVTILVDLDHLPEYVWWRREKSGVADFFATNRAHLGPTLFLPLHSWEFWLLGSGLLYFLWGPVWGLAPATGWLLHLLCDQIANRPGPGVYFFFFRAARGFKRSRLPVDQPELDTGPRP